MTLAKSDENSLLEDAAPILDDLLGLQDIEQAQLAMSLATLAKDLAVSNSDEELGVVDLELLTKLYNGKRTPKLQRDVYIPSHH